MNTNWSPGYGSQSITLRNDVNISLPFDLQKIVIFKYESFKDLYSRQTSVSFFKINIIPVTPPLIDTR